MQNEGDVYARLATAYEDHNGFSAVRSDAYAEYGLTPVWTLSGKFEQVDFSRSNVFDSTGYRLTARRKIWSSGNWSSTAGAGILEGAAIGGFRGCESFGGEVNAGIGRSGTLWDRSYFSSLTIVHRQHSDACSMNRLEFILGITRDSGWTNTFQYWSERGDTGQSDKIEFMVSRQFGPIEVGSATRTEISGEFDETALVLSLAYRR
ncbi:MAG: hypothetical protein CMK09_07680 [Ponticaulis sp.]|nr:hypothetical protein [Ponticaulis sp.]